MLARRWPPGLRLSLAAMALLLFLCLAGAQPLVVRVGHQRWQLVSSPQALCALQQRQRSEPRQLITGTWLGFKPSAPSAVGF